MFVYKSLENIFSILKIMYDPIIRNTKIDTEYMISKLQEINNELSSILKSFGTECLGLSLFVLDLILLTQF